MKMQMQIIFLINLQILSFSICQITDKKFTISKEYINNLKKVIEFEIYDYEEHHFKDYTSQELQMKLGLKGLVLKDIHLPIGNICSDLPADFIAHDKWPKCIHGIRNQGICGSCWAFAITEVLSDRICIASDGAIDVVLSPQDMVSCDTNDMGCAGGYLDKSWQYVINIGVVTEECYPYTSDSGESGTCKILEDKCADGMTLAKKYKAKSYNTFQTVNEIKNEIFNNGPVETGFLVYQDFISYKGGIYKKSSDILLGGHAVKIVGWGYEKKSKIEFWIVANSWGPKWGEQGHFRIQINNCCDFEANAIAGTPDIDSLEYLY